VRDRGPSGFGPDRPGPDRVQYSRCLQVVLFLGAIMSEPIIFGNAYMLFIA
jgi:hypothetical protein